MPLDVNVFWPEQIIHQLLTKWVMTIKQTKVSLEKKNMHEFNKVSLGLAFGGGANICWTYSADTVKAGPLVQAFVLNYLPHDAMRIFIFFCVCVWVCAWLISTVCIHIVTIGDQLDELCSFSGSLPHVYLD